MDHTQEEKKKDEVQTVRTFSEARTDRYCFRVLEKSWAKGNFYSLERNDLVETDDGQFGVAKRAKNMFTLPKDAPVLKVIFEGIQSVMDTVENNGGSSSKKKK